MKSAVLLLLFPALTTGCAVSFNNPLEGAGRVTPSSSASNSGSSGGNSSPPLLGIHQTDSSSADFSLGTSLHVSWSTPASWLQLTDPTANLSGTFASRIIDAQSSVAWNSLGWVPEQAYDKELPDNAQAESGYPSGSSLMAGAVLYLHMDEASWTGTGPQVIDASGNGNNGTADNASTVPGRFNRAGHFVSASSSFVSVPYKASLNTNQFTVMAWARLANYGDNGDNDILNSSDIAGNGLDIEIYQGQLCVFASPMSGCASVGPFVNDTYWHHFALSFDGTNLKAYVDGVFQGPALTPGAFVANSDYDTVIGAFCNAADCDSGAGYAEPFNGDIDEVAMFNSALPASQIAGIYTMGEHNLNMSGNLLLMHLDEAAWAGVPGEVKDSSGNGNNGEAIAGASILTSGRFNNAGSFTAASSQFVKVPHFGALDSLSAQTIMTWIKFTSFADATILNNIGSLGGVDLEVQFGQGGLYCDGNGHGTQYYGPLINDGNWHHLAAVFDGTTQTLYVDGVQQNNQTCTFQGNDQDVQIGAYCGGANSTSCAEWLDGQMDEVAIFNRALLNTEIFNIYQRGAERLRFQVRSCSDATCTSGTFAGPDGTAATYFTELGNATLGPPSFSLPDVLANEYFQYKAYFDSDNTKFTPDLVSVTIGPQH